MEDTKSIPSPIIVCSSSPPSPTRCVSPNCDNPDHLEDRSLFENTFLLKKRRAAMKALPDVLVPQVPFSKEAHHRIQKLTKLIRDDEERGISSSHRINLLCTRLKGPFRDGWPNAVGGDEEIDMEYILPNTDEEWYAWKMRKAELRERKHTSAKVEAWRERINASDIKLQSQPTQHDDSMNVSDANYPLQSGNNSIHRTPSPQQLASPPDSRIPITHMPVLIEPKSPSRLRKRQSQHVSSSQSLRKSPTPILQVPQETSGSRHKGKTKLPITPISPEIIKGTPRYMNSSHGSPSKRHRTREAPLASQTKHSQSSSRSSHRSPTQMNLPVSQPSSSQQKAGADANQGSISTSQYLYGSQREILSQPSRQRTDSYSRELEEEKENIDKQKSLRDSLTFTSDIATRKNRFNISTPPELETQNRFSQDAYSLSHFVAQDVGDVYGDGVISGFEEQYLQDPYADDE